MVLGPPHFLPTTSDRTCKKSEWGKGKKRKKKEEKGRKKLLSMTALPDLNLGDPL